MIASIFNKSKPINFIIVIAIIVLMFGYAAFKFTDGTLTLGFATKQLFKLAISVFSIFLLNFIVVKNKLIEHSSYHILLFGLFLAMFPITLISSKLLLANVFILMALRRIISLRSQINVKKKLFDASFWIAIAAIFHFWAILFFILIFIALFLFSDNEIKDWIIPYTGIAAVLIMVVSYHLAVYNNIEELISQLPRLNFDFINYNSIGIIVAITLLLSFGLWSAVFYVRIIKNKLKVFKPSHKIVFAAVIIALTVVVLTEEKNSSEFIFLFAPLAIIIANYLDTTEEKWFKELFLAVLVVTPFVLLVL